MTTIEKQIQVKKAKQHVEAIKESLRIGGLLQEEKADAIYDAALFLYANGYSTRDDVHMLLSLAAFRDHEQTIEILEGMTE